MALNSSQLATVVADTPTDLVTCSAGNTLIVIGLTICNTGAGNATINLDQTDASNVLLGAIIDDYSLAASQTLFIDTKFVLAATQKLRFTSNSTDLSVCVTYDESAV